MRRTNLGIFNESGKRKLKKVVTIKYTAKNRQVATSLVTSCNRLEKNKPISRFVRMVCDSLLTTSLFQVVNRFVAG